MEISRKMIEAINGFFRPTKISHREEQIKEIREVFDRLKNNKHEKNLFIHGTTGSGKTISIESILKEYDKDDYIYIPFPQTAHQVLKAITDVNYNTRERQRIEALKKIKTKKIVLIIDEFNSINRISEIIYLLEDLKFIYRQCPFPIIIITNKNLYEMSRIIPKDVEGTFHFNKIYFKPYNASQLKDILLDGVSYMNLNINEGLINYLSAKVCNDFDSSVRAGIFVLRELIDQSNLEIFSKEAVDNILDKQQVEEFEESISSLPETEKKFLNTLLEFLDDCEKIYGKRVVPISYLRSKLKIFPSRISQLILSLEAQGILIKASFNGDKRKASIKFIREDIEEKTLDVLNKLEVGYLS